MKKEKDKDNIGTAVLCEAPLSGNRINWPSFISISSISLLGTAS